MGTFAVRVAGVGLLALLSGCAPQSPPKGAPRPTPKATHPLEIVTSPEPDLSKVEAPVGVFAVVRVVHPSTLAEGVGNWVGFPISLGMLDALEPGMSTMVAADAPVEVVAALGRVRSEVMEAPMAVVSVGIAQPDAARKLFESRTGQTMLPKGLGIWQSPEDASPHCAFAPAVGAASTRFVCGTAEEALATLLPYAVRGLPLEDLGKADIHAELRLADLADRYRGLMRTGKSVLIPELMKELNLQASPLQRPLASLLHALGDEVIATLGDTDRVMLDATLDTTTARVRLDMVARLRGVESWVGSSVAELAGQAIPPPPAFLSLPADSATATYAIPLKAARWERPSRLVGELLEVWLTQAGVDPNLRQQSTKAVAGLFLMSAPSVSASGPVVLDRAAREKKDASPIAERVAWQLYGFDSPGTPLRDTLVALSRLTNDPGFRKSLARDLGAQRAPNRWNPAEEAAANALIPRVRSVTIPGLPKGAESFALEVNRAVADELLSGIPRYRSRAARPTTVELCIVVVSDGSRSWLVVTGDRSTAVERTRRILVPGSAATLATRGDLATLRAEPAASAGYTSLMALRGLLVGLAVKEGKPLSTIDSLFETVPNRATTPMIERTTVTGGKSAPVVESHLVIPRQVVDDITASIPILMMLD
jgi:hypothetical protein